MKPPYNYTTSQHVSSNLYAMKRQYGAPILVRRALASTADPKTGDSVLTVQTLRVRRAVVLEGVVTRNAKQSISLVTAQKQMVMGGGFDVGKRTFIIDRKDVPRDFVLAKDDWIVFDNRHFDIDTLKEYEFRTAWVVIGKELTGRVEGMDDYHPNATDTLAPADDAAASH
jgi:hypothetical protein